MICSHDAVSTPAKRQDVHRFHWRLGSHHWNTQGEGPLTWKPTIQWRLKATSLVEFKENPVEGCSIFAHVRKLHESPVGAKMITGWIWSTRSSIREQLHKNCIRDGHPWNRTRGQVRGHQVTLLHDFEDLPICPSLLVMTNLIDQNTFLGNQLKTVRERVRFHTRFHMFSFSVSGLDYC